MSWNVNMVGKPAKVVEALKAKSAKESGQCKVEYDAALPHLVGLVENNFAKEGSGYTEYLVHLEASGSGTSRGEDQLQRTC